MCWNVIGQAQSSNYSNGFQAFVLIHKLQLQSPWLKLLIKYWYSCGFGYMLKLSINRKYSWKLTQKKYSLLHQYTEDRKQKIINTEQVCAQHSININRNASNKRGIYDWIQSYNVQVLKRNKICIIIITQSDSISHSWKRAVRRMTNSPSSHKHWPGAQQQEVLWANSRNMRTLGRRQTERLLIV